VLDRALLLTSEVVTNAVLHARTPLTLTIHDDGTRLRVDVEDGDERPPVKLPQSGPSGGFGMHIVEQLSDNWGVAPRDDGKVVWFEMAVPKPRSRGRAATALATARR
jgi:anti-sigma regulatory factor (Ser/Thr protein kinase)